MHSHSRIRLALSFSYCISYTVCHFRDCGSMWLHDLGVGEVVAVGEGDVLGLVPGDRVVAAPGSNPSGTWYVLSVDSYTVRSLNDYISDLLNIYIILFYLSTTLRANFNCFAADRLIKISSDIPLQYASSIAGSPVAALRMIREFHTLQKVN